MSTKLLHQLNHLQDKAQDNMNKIQDIEATFLVSKIILEHGLKVIAMGNIPLKTYLGSISQILKNNNCILAMNEDLMIIYNHINLLYSRLVECGLQSTTTHIASYPLIEFHLESSKILESRKLKDAPESCTTSISEWSLLISKLEDLVYRSESLEYFSEPVMSKYKTEITNYSKELLFVSDQRLKILKKWGLSNISDIALLQFRVESMPLDGYHDAQLKSGLFF